MSQTQRFALTLTLLAGFGLIFSPFPSPADETKDQSIATDDGWPRKIVSDDTTITVYQPQIEKWDGNQLEARAAVSVETKIAAAPTFGVIWTTARTEVDKEYRLVTLEDFKVTKASFPSAPDKAKEYLDIIRRAPHEEFRRISLDRLEANLAITQAENKTKTVPLKNDPPQIIFSTKPAVLVLIDGKPALRQVEGTNLLRIINTRSLILLDEKNGKYYLHIMDGWVGATSIDGPWTTVKDPPDVLGTVVTRLGTTSHIDLMNNLSIDLADAVESGIIPTVFTSTTPAELIETQGEPDFAPIDGTKLLWVKNTSSKFLLDTADQKYYVLLSGRWFRSKSLKGPWDFVPPNKLPPDFAKIPETHPRGDVLSSVSGTPQAQESLIANQVPQTATIKRSEAKFAPTFDGKPDFQPVEGTQLKYAANSPTPVIQVKDDSYYGVENGVWFNASAPDGPWSAATSVPPVIYTIPPSSPVYNVTYVQVYGSTPDYVYLGYTPGYFGTCVCPEGVVVYGTGWNFPPWIGTVWYGRPWTYGWGATFGWTAGGWGFGFTTAWGRPWWGPVGWHAGWGGNWWNTGWNTGWGGRFTNAHINNINFNNFNLYNRWGKDVHVSHLSNTVFAPRRVEGNTINFNRSVNNVFASREGNVYRRVNNNTWETHVNNGWQNFERTTLPAERRNEYDNILRSYNDEWGARRYGETNWNAFRSAYGNYTARPYYDTYRPSYGGLGAYHTAYGGFRSYGGAGFGGYHYGGFAGFRGGFRGRR